MLASDLWLKGSMLYALRQTDRMVFECAKVQNSSSLTV